MCIIFFLTFKMKLGTTVEMMDEDYLALRKQLKIIMNLEL